MGRVSRWARRWVVGRLSSRIALLAVGLWLAAVCRRNRRAATAVPLSPIRGTRRIGADYFDRAGFAAGAPAPANLVAPAGNDFGGSAVNDFSDSAPDDFGDSAEDDIGGSAEDDYGGSVDSSRFPAAPSDSRGAPDSNDDSLPAVAPGTLAALDTFAGTEFDPDAVDPAVRSFFEGTGEYATWIRVRWGYGVGRVARLATVITDRVRQLHLPGGGCEWLRLSGHSVPVTVPGDPREDVHGRVYTSTTGDDGRPGVDDAVVVSLCGSHERDGERFVDVAVPLPGGNLGAVLRVRNLDGGVVLTTAGDGNPGLYAVTPLGPFRLPVRQRVLTHRIVGDEGDHVGSGGAREPPGDPDLLATHELWFLGFPFLAVDYRIERVDG